MVSNRFLTTRKAQKGATMVEVAITFPLFIVLVFAIIEFALVIFTWTRAVEATRAGARYAIVNDEVVDLSGMDCDDGDTVSTTCDNGDCDALMEHMNSLYADLDPGNVTVSYACSSTGFPDRPDSLALREVNVSITGQEYQMILPGLIGVDPTLTLPSFSSTRVSEDLDTPEG